MTGKTEEQDQESQAEEASRLSVPHSLSDAVARALQRESQRPGSMESGELVKSTEVSFAESVADESIRNADGPSPSATIPPMVTPVERVSRPHGVANEVQVRYFGKTDVGLVREHNEDNFLVADLTSKRRGVGSAIIDAALGERGCILAVCDGMGGAAFGEVASQMAVDTLFRVFDESEATKTRDEFARRIVRSVETAGHEIFGAAKANRNQRGMGTTTTLAGLVDDTLFVGQVGDSRAYVLRGKNLVQITKDQSLVNQLIEAGQLTEEEAEQFEHTNIILQALGTTEEVTVDLTFLELRRGDRLMLCSDGLSGMVHGDMIKDAMLSIQDLGQLCQRLIEMARAGGGHDNITVIAADFDGPGLKPADDAKPAYQQYPLPPEHGASSVIEHDAEPMKIASEPPRSNATARRISTPTPEPTSSKWPFAVAIVLLLAIIAAIVVLRDTGERRRGQLRSTSSNNRP